MQVLELGILGSLFLIGMGLYVLWSRYKLQRVVDQVVPDFSYKLPIDSFMLYPIYRYEQRGDRQCWIQTQLRSHIGSDRQRTYYFRDPIVGRLENIVTHKASLLMLVPSGRGVVAKNVPLRALKSALRLFHFVGDGLPDPLKMH